MSEKVTFTTASERRRTLNDETIDAIVDDALEDSLGKHVNFVKSYLDRVPKDDSDNEFHRDVEQQIASHAQLAQLISEKVRLTGIETYSPGKQAAFGRKLDEYRQDLSQGTAIMADYLRDTQRGVQSRFPTKAATYMGLTMKRSDGSAVDFVSGDSVGGIQSNVYIQSEIAGTFVHITSDKYLALKAEGQKPKLDKRIYLNPRSAEVVTVFRRVLELAEAQDIPMKGKVLDKSIEPLLEDTDRGDARGDAIVLYVDEANADALLREVKQVYIEHKDAFANRRVSKIPMPIAPGVGIGDEPDSASGASLTSHRSDIIEDAARATREALRQGNTEPKTKIFRGFLRAAAHSAGVNPDNLAFNKK
jgi:hypothetical protein